MVNSTQITLFSKMLKFSKNNYFFQKKFKNIVKENSEYLGIFHLLKWKFSKLINYWTNMCWNGPRYYSSCTCKRSENTYVALLVEEKRKGRMKLSLSSKLVEKTSLGPSYFVFVNFFIPSYMFDALLCRNWPFLPPLTCDVTDNSTVWTNTCQVHFLRTSGNTLFYFILFLGTSFPILSVVAVFEFWTWHKGGRPSLYYRGGGVVTRWDTYEVHLPRTSHDISYL